MTDTTKKEITKIVKQVLKETGKAIPSSAKPVATQRKPSENRPAVLNIFHGGVRKLDEALAQVQKIDEASRRSSVFTVESARSWVCGADVKEGAGVKCILDTVKPEGLEKALQKADILVLPTFCMQTAAKVARLICDDQESRIVFLALLQGKKVLATNDGFMLRDILVNDQLRREIDQILDKLQGFGMVFCPTDQLYATFEQMATFAGPAPSETKSQKHDNGGQALSLITAKVIHTAVNSKQDSVMLAPGGILTPLAKDLAKEYAIKIIRNK
jgi:hypothetical protein